MPGDIRLLGELKCLGRAMELTGEGSHFLTPVSLNEQNYHHITVRPVNWISLGWDNGKQEESRKGDRIFQKTRLLLSLHPSRHCSELQAVRAGAEGEQGDPPDADQCVGPCRPLEGIPLPHPDSAEGGGLTTEGTRSRPRVVLSEEREAGRTSRWAQLPLEAAGRGFQTLFSFSQETQRSL